MEHNEIISNKPFLRLIVVILACIGFALPMALSGCYTERKGVKQSVKAYTFYPGVVAGLHTKWFPIKDSISERVVYKPGEVQWRYDTLTIDCDSVLAVFSGGQLENEPSLKPKVVRIPCPPCPISVDTFEHYKYRSEESTAALQAKQAQYDKLEADKAKVEKKLAKTQNTLSITLWSLIAISSYTLLRWILRAWIKINLP